MSEGKRVTPQIQTWVMRAQGSGYDPETCCEYTGLPLHLFPVLPDLMGYWRTDGILRACRPLTTEEKFWILANPEPFAEEVREFQKWRQTLKPLEQ